MHRRTRSRSPRGKGREDDDEPSDDHPVDGGDDFVDPATLSERFKMRIEAETGMAAVSAFFAGFALTMLDEGKEYTDHFYLLFLRVVCFAFVASANLFVVVISVFFQFAGFRLLAKSTKGAKKLNRGFNGMCKERD